MNGHRALLLFPLILLLAAAQVYADDLLDRFRKEYPAASQMLEEAYSHSRAVGTYSRTDSHGAFLYNETFEDERRPGAVRDLSTYLKSNFPRVSPGLMVAGGGTAKKYFDLSRRPGKPNYTIDQFGPDADFEADTRLYIAPLFAPYCAETYHVRDLFADPQTTLSSAKVTTVGTQSVVEVDFKETRSDGFVVQGSIFFLQPSWAITSWHFTYVPVDRTTTPTTQPTVSEAGTVEYSAIIPIPKVSKVVRFRITPRGPVDQMSWDVSNLQFVEIPEKQFELSAFGIEEPPAPIVYGEKHP